MSASPDRVDTADAARPAPETFADRVAKNAYFRAWVTLVAPLGLSVALHAVIFVLLAMKTFAWLAPAGLDVGDYSATLTEALGVSEGTGLDWYQPGGLAGLSEPIDESLGSLGGLDVPDDALRDLSRAPGQGGGQTGGLGLGEGPLALLGTGGGAGPAESGGLGSGLGGAARLGEGGMWGMRFRARKLVYVVDFSGSIIVAVDVLKRELKRSISGLKPDQSFNVILFYSAGGGVDERLRTEQFRPQLEPATDATRRAFFEWIDAKAPRGQTEPREAIQRALELEPEVILFHSDGFFDESVVPEIARLNRRRVQVHCLVFDELLLKDASDLPPKASEGAERMKRIADQNRGQFKIVTGKDLRRVGG